MHIRTLARMALCTPNLAYLKSFPQYSGRSSFERSKGFGFVTVTDKTVEEVLKALDGHSVKGRRLKVQKAKGGRAGGKGGGNNRSARERQARKEEGIED